MNHRPYTRLFRVAAGVSAPQSAASALHIAKPTSGKHSQITMNSEVTRKLLHIASLSIPIFYYFVSCEVALAVLIPFTALSIFMDYGRFYIKWVAKIVNTLFGSILREHELGTKRKLLTGATYVAISATLCVLVFPKVIAITAFSLLIICDTASALIGRKYGKRAFLDKSLVGTLAFIIFGALVVLFAPKAIGMWQEYVLGFLGAIVAGIIEGMSVRLRMDDNFSIPISAGVVMWLGYYLLSVASPERFAPLYQALIHF